MEKTNVYLLIPEYYGITGVIQSAYDLATSVDPDGPIQFHLVDYPEEDPKEGMIYDEDWTGDTNIEMSIRFESFISDNYNFIPPAKEIRKHLDIPEHLIERMGQAEHWLFKNKSVDPDHSLVVLLNPYGNTNNYFCAPSPERRNVAFIQTTHFATETLTAPHIPVAYEFFASALRFRAFNVPDYQSRFVHIKDKGCVNDFFEDIQDIRLKILTADICDSCYAHIRSQSIDRVFMEHIRCGLEKVRDQQNNFKRALIDPTLIKIRLGQRYLHFDEFSTKILLSPKEMTLYKFFVSKPQGVPYSEISNHKKELLSIYRMHYSGQDDEMESTIHAVVDRWGSWDSDISQTVSKINRKIKYGITPILAKPHLIEGERNGPKKIAYCSRAK